VNSINNKRKERYLARRYAQAFLNVFGKKLSASDQENLCAGATFFEEHRKAIFLMQLGFLEEEIKLEALTKIGNKMGLPAIFENLMKLLVEHKRAFLLEEVFKQLCSIFKEQLGTMQFTVKSAGELTDEQKKEVVAFLAKETGKNIFCIYKQDPSLIAGIHLQNEHFLWENSIRGRLSRVQGSLKR